MINTDNGTGPVSLTTGEPLASWPRNWLELAKVAMTADPDLIPLLDGEGTGSVTEQMIRARDILGKHTGDPFKVEAVIFETRLGELCRPTLAKEVQRSDRERYGWAPPKDAPLADRIESGDAWARRAPKSVPRIIPGILPFEGITIMSAHSETGKTWLLISMLLAVGNSLPFLGQYHVERPGKCLYIATEGSHAGAVARFHALARGMGLHPVEAMRNIDILWKDKTTMLDTPEFQGEMVELAPDYALIGCDIVSDLWAGDENKNAEVIALLRALRPLTAAGTSIILVHHWAKDSDGTAGRDEGQRSRGAVAWKTNTDSGIYLTRKKGAGRTIVTCTSSDDVPAPPFTFTWPMKYADGSEPVTLDWQADTSGLNSMQLIQRQAEALISTEPGLSANAIAERIHGNRKALSAALLGLEKLGTVQVRPVTFTDKANRTGRRHPGYFTAVPQLISLFPESPETERNTEKQRDL